MHQIDRLFYTTPGEITQYKHMRRYFYWLIILLLADVACFSYAFLDTL